MDNTNWFQGILQGIIGQAVWVLLISFGVLMIELWRQYGAKIPRMIYLSLLLGLLSFFGLMWKVNTTVEKFDIYLSQQNQAQQEVTTSANVQERVRGWLDNFKTDVKSAPDESVLFRYVVTKDGGTHISISRIKNYANYLMLQTQLTYSEDDQKLLSKLSKLQNDELLLQLVTDAGSQNVAFRKKGQSIYLEKLIPINSLSEIKLLEGINSMDTTMVLQQITITTALLRANLIK